MPVQLNHTIVRVRDKRGRPPSWPSCSGSPRPRPSGRSWSCRSTTTSPSTSPTTRPGPSPALRLPGRRGRDSTRSSAASASGPCPSGPTRAGAGRVRSTPTTAAAASTGRTERPLPGDHPARTAAAADPAGRCSLVAAASSRETGNGPAGTVRVRLPQPAPRGPPGLLPGPGRPRCSRPCARSRVGGC